MNGTEWRTYCADGYVCPTRHTCGRYPPPDLPGVEALTFHSRAGEYAQRMGQRCPWWVMGVTGRQSNDPR